MHTQIFDLRDTKGQQSEVEDKILSAAKIIQRGGLVVIPTETVYGLSANGLDPQAVTKIFQVKGRPQDNPLLLHVAGAQWLPRFCRDVPPIAYQLVRKFWPGPLTLVLKRNPMIPDTTTAGLDTVAVRCPDHPVTLSIIREAGVPIAAPSANLSGRPSCTNAQDVIADMMGQVDAVVDGGPCRIGVESTILDLTCDPPRLLRPGGLPLEDLERLLGYVEIDPAVVGTVEIDQKPKAPGMKYRHYAPDAPVTVITGTPSNSASAILDRITPQSGVICFDEYAHLFQGHKTLTLGSADDKQTQAQRLFDALRAFNGSNVDQIFTQCPDRKGLGLAIGNRLKKAAGFHVIDADGIQVVLGITGGTGSGKTSALRAIQELGGVVFDCDVLYYELLAKDKALQDALEGAFGSSIFTPDDQLDRHRLGEIVFSNKDNLARLNDITFQFLIPELTRRMQNSPASLYGIDAISLFESGANRMCDRIVAVTAPMELRVRRIMRRDHIDEQYARLRIAAQKSDDFFRERCDCELENASDTAAKFQLDARLFFEKLIDEIKEEKASGKFRATASDAEE